MGRPETKPIFRGWWVLAGLFLMYAAGNGVIMHTLPLLYPEFIQEFAWTEVQVTLPATMFFVIGALTSPPAGVLLDRYSPRQIMLVGAGRSYGKILAILVLVDTLAGALGTRVTAMMRVAYESYEPAFDLLVVVCVIAIVALLFLRKPSTGE